MSGVDTRIAVQPGETPAGPSQRKRSRNGCLTCRTRKVKCDQVRDLCGPCERLQLDCVWQATAMPEGDGSPSSAPRKRFKTPACDPCRTAKARCDRTSESDACGRCQSLSLICARPVERSRPPSHRRSLDPAQTRDAWTPSVKRYRTPPTTAQREIIDLFFDLVHPSEGIEFVHRGDFMRDFVDERVPPLLLKSIVLVTGRYLPSANGDHPDGGEELEQLATEVKALIMADTDRFSLIKLAALLILRAHEVSAGRHGSGWLLVSLISRMAFGMALNAGPSGRHVSTAAAAEMRKRIMWATHAADSNAAGGIEEYSLSDRRVIRVSLPVSERAWAVSQTVEGRTIDDVEFDPSPGPDGTDGIAGRAVRVVCLRNDILSYTKYIHRYEIPPWEPGSRFEVICQKLRCWSSSLPPELKFGVDSLYALKAQPGHLNALAILHLWFDQLHCTLYRMTFPGFDESAPPDLLADAPPEWLEKLRTGCYSRAIEVREKIRFLGKHGMYLKVDGFRVAGFVYECIRNQLAYLHLAHPQGVPPDLHQQTLDGFDDMVRFVTNCSASAATLRKPLRRILHMLSRHGYQLETPHEMSEMETRPPSPGQGSVIGRLPFFQGLLRHPYAEEPSSATRRDTSSRNVDPVTQEPLTLSPAGLVEPTSHGHTRSAEPIVADEDVSRLFDDIFNPVLDANLLPTETIAPLWTDIQESFAPWIEAEPWFTSETWMAHPSMTPDLAQR